MQYLSIFVGAFSGLGLFLFGMFYLETMIRDSSSYSLKKIMQNATNTNLKSLFIGIFSTTVFQSSSIVCLLVLSLIGAELMNLQSAIAVIIGANLGTTGTAWIMAIIGFKTNINLISSAIVGIGGLGMILATEEGKWKKYFGILVGIGLIFLGLSQMKDSLSIFSQNFDVASIKLENPYWYAIVGLILTAIIQSSSASIAIIQSALFANIITFEAAGAFVLGADIGTTLTIILGAIGGIPDKKRAAAAQVIFNISTDLIALCLLYPLVSFINFLLPSASGVIKIAAFHSLYNIIGVFIWFPFISKFSSILKYFFKKKITYATKYINQIPAQNTDIAIDALKKEIGNLSKKIEKLALLAINISDTTLLEKDPPPKIEILKNYTKNLDKYCIDIYTKIRLQEGEIYRYISTVSIKNKNKTFQETINHLYRRTTYLATASKSIKDMLQDLNKLYEASSYEEYNLYQNLRYQILLNTIAYHQTNIQNLKNLYKNASDSHKYNLSTIEKFAQNPHIKSEMTAIIINDLYLIKTFSGSLINALER